ncbi:uncharacterized protein LOC126088425 [Schistocerca cancellata]|uniref:uncharacterized protein LOC126088425 n=1 Tax=Schistocerca cancellata TaxID=274614 RepID=UPI002118E41F|nr:uncharacterized protein LOC126088425 [Schistocerca cancellata]
MYQHQHQHHGPHAPLGRQKSAADLLAYRRFSPTKFARSVVGVLKIVITVLFLVAAVVFLSSEVCPRAPDWYVWLYPTAAFLTAALTICTYIFYVLGVAEDEPDNWVRADLTLIALELGLTIGAAVATLANCDSSESRFIFYGPLALVGSLLVAVSGGALYMMWRYREDVEEPQDPQLGADRNRAVSVVI